MLRLRWSFVAALALAGCSNDPPRPATTAPIVIKTDATDLARFKLRTGGHPDQLIGVSLPPAQSESALKQQVHAAGPLSAVALPRGAK
jgi:hypothetical protein